MTDDEQEDRGQRQADDERVGDARPARREPEHVAEFAGPHVALERLLPEELRPAGGGGRCALISGIRLAAHPRIISDVVRPGVAVGSLVAGVSLRSGDVEMHRLSGRHWIQLLVVTVACLIPAAVIAHPGSGIVVDRLGQVYFVDMVSGVWKLDVHGALTHLPGPAFHWMTLDADDRFGAVRLPSGAGGDIARIGASPTLLLGSDVPLAIGQDGNLYYPSHEAGTPLQVLRFLPTGQRSILGSLPAATPRGPLRDLNGLAAGPDGSLFYTEDDAIRRISREGHVSSAWAMASCPPLPGKSAKGSPLLRGLVVDSGGTIYVAATGCGAVIKTTPTGQVSILPQVERPWSPTGVALFGGDVYVLEFQDAESDDRQAMLPRVRRISASGKTAVIATVTRHGPVKERPFP